MSSPSLPTVGGYDGPFSLKAFMRLYFDIEVRYGRPPRPPPQQPQQQQQSPAPPLSSVVPPETSGASASVLSALSSSPSSSSPLHLSLSLPTQGSSNPLSPPPFSHPPLYLQGPSAFAVVVYVAKGAVPPPAQPPSANTPNNAHHRHHHRNNHKWSESVTFLHRRQGPTGPAVAGGVDISWSSNDSSNDTGPSPSPSSAAAAASFMAPLLQTVLLREKIFGVLFDRLGPAATAFTAARCALLVQFDAAGGALQVMGPSLSGTAAGVIDAGVGRRPHFHARANVVSCGGKRRRGPSVTTVASGSSCRGGAMTRAELDSRPTAAGAPNAHQKKQQQLSSSALLGRTAVPRRGLCDSSSGGNHAAAALLLVPQQHQQHQHQHQPSCYVIIAATGWLAFSMCAAIVRKTPIVATAGAQCSERQCSI